MKPTYSIYELICLMIAGVVCVFIIMEGIIMMNRPTNPDNVEIRKQIISVLQFLAGGVMGILATKLNIRKDG